MVQSLRSPVSADADYVMLLDFNSTATVHYVRLMGAALIICSSVSPVRQKMVNARVKAMEQQVGRRSHVPTFLRAAARNLSETGRGRKQAISILVDSCTVVFSLWAAYALRIGAAEVNGLHLLYHFLLLPPITILIFTSLGIYRWIVRSSTFGLFLQVAKGVVGSSVALLILLYLIPPDSANPRSVFVIYGLILITLCCGLRLLWKALFDSGNHGAPIAIFGAGSAGTQLAGILKNGHEYRPICFIDDNKSFVGSTIKGLPILDGRAQNLYARLLRLEITEVIIAIPSMNSSDYSDIYDRLEALGIPFKTSPSFAELVSGQGAIGEIRQVSVNDILGRNEVLPDPQLLQDAVRGKSILVTGGGGSIGSELCRQIIRQKPRKLTVLDNSEANLYHIGEEILQSLDESGNTDDIEFDTILCSVADRLRVQCVFDKQHFDTVYHAAAYKHVPIVERFPEQGIEVNVFGTLNLVEAAMESGVGRFVLISTDKAVRPTSAMGASKRVAELILQAKSRLPGNTIISMVRFGNVLASNGSVVPKFSNQIAAGGPVTLTDPDITRYFMTIPEASQLVLQASAISRGGDVLVLDMGEPVKISQLARTMIRLHCQQVEQAGGTRPVIEIKVTGLRPGEKMYEELFMDATCERTAIAKVLSANEQYLTWNKLESELNNLRSVLIGCEAEVVKKQLFDVVFHKDQLLDVAGDVGYGQDSVQTDVKVEALHP